MKRCFSLYPDLTCLLKCLIDGGVQKMLEECTLKPGLPVQPMLGQISRGITHAVKQFNGTFLAEFKYDGMRAQIHVLPNETRVFSRKNEDKTGQMPDVARITRECLVPSVSTAVLDAECVAIERSTGKFKSFQELSTRSRSDIEESQVNVDVAIFVFDMMYINGRTLVDLPLAERRAYAQESLHEAANVIQLAESTTIAEGTSQEECEECVTSMLHSSLSQQGEGLMLKKLHQPGALYEPGRRSESWMKVKKDYCSELREPLDLVVIGAWWGNGRKAGWLSPFLLACYDPEQEEYQSVCRCVRFATFIAFHIFGRSHISAFYTHHMNLFSFGLHVFRCQVLQTHFTKSGRRICWTIAYSTTSQYIITQMSDHRSGLNRISFGRFEERIYPFLRCTVLHLGACITHAD